jgi:hypothetical protein
MWLRNRQNPWQKILILQQYSDFSVAVIPAVFLHPTNVPSFRAKRGISLRLMSAARAILQRPRVVFVLSKPNSAF